MHATRRWSRRRWLQALAGAAAAGRPAQAAGGAEAWRDGDRPSAAARQAVALLAAAGDDGLDPDDYGAGRLAALLAEAAGPAALARLTAALNPAFEAFLADLAFGRIDPRLIHHRFSVAPRAGFDPVAVLQLALGRGRPGDAVAAARPTVPQYSALRAALSDHRALAGHPAWERPLPPLPRPAGTAAARRAGKLEPGRAWDGLPRLVERLAALGDLAPGAGSGGAHPAAYTGTLVDAVRRFQARHALAVDGVVGRATRAALEVPPEARARQIALTMERLRWTPLMLGPRMVVIAIPEFVLRAYEVVDGRIHVRATMRVIVGDALDWQTPLFDERMRRIEFGPYWNVPPSIARGELVPRLRRDPAHWAAQGFEFVDATGWADPVLSPAGLDAVIAGRLRIRQRPGPANALGAVKFVFPNRDAIYLHDTPSTSLFARERRDLSHGCIRVEDPVTLARFVLAGRPGWDEEHIRAAMATGTPQTLVLADPVPVLIAYGTAIVKDGRPHFYEDVYGHDARLDAALRERRATPPSRSTR